MQNLSCIVREIVLLVEPACAWASAAAAMLYSPALERGYQNMYNLDFSGAHETFRGYQQAHADDPMGYVSNAAAYLFSEFNRLHILESDLFYRRFQV